MTPTEATGERTKRGIGVPVVSRFDAALALAVLLVQVGATYAAARHQHVHRPWDALAVALLAAGPIALLVRRRYPVAVLAVALSTALAYWVIGYGKGPLFLALIVAFITTVLTGHRRAAVASLAVGFTGFLWLAPVLGREKWPSLGGVLALAAWLLVLLAGGEAIRARGARAGELARVREAEVARQVSEERLRIARELHDVLAHNISLINVQASTSLHRAQRSEERAYEALATIKKVTQETLVELRSLLGALREVDEGASRAPAPTLARVEELVASAAAAGVAAHLEVCNSARPLPAGVDLAAYRIVQEALTNVGRHSGASTADVRIVYGDDDLVVQVDNPGTGAAGPVRPGTGITGMTERASALGGNLQAGPRPGGGFRVRAWLPFGNAK
jgi:signal transduction histidine kinase